MFLFIAHTFNLFLLVFIFHISINARISNTKLFLHIFSYIVICLLFIFFFLPFFSISFFFYYILSSQYRFNDVNVVLIFKDSLIAFAPSDPIPLSVHYSFSSFFFSYFFHFIPHHHFPDSVMSMDY